MPWATLSTKSNLVNSAYGASKIVDRPLLKGICRQ